MLKIRLTKSLFCLLLTFFYTEYYSEKPSNRVIGKNNANKIIAIVNDNIITKVDVVNRMKLITKLANLSISEADEEIFLKNTRATLIDETLKLEQISDFIKKYNDNKPLVQLEELEKYLKSVLAKSAISEDEFKAFLKRHDIAYESVLRQIDVNLSWNRYIVEFYGGNVQISDSEINSYINQLSNESKCKTYVLGRIVIPFSSANENEAKLKIDEAFYYLQKGVAFELVASNFSNAADAKNGGFLGPVKEKQLNEREAQVVIAAKVGHYSAVIRNEGEFVIYKIYDVKKEGDNYLTKITAKRIEYSVNKNDMENVAKEVLCNTENAGSFFASAKNDPRVTVNDNEEFIVEDMRPEVQSFMLSLELGSISAPIPTEKGFAVFYTTKKEKIYDKSPSKAQVKMIIQNKKLESMSRKHFQAIKSGAYIKKNDF